MISLFKSKLVISLSFLIVLLAIFLFYVSSVIEESNNKVLSHTPYKISEKALKLHQTLIIGDLHSDSFLWNRNLLERSEIGHVDIPRMLEGNAALQIFTSVTKSPAGLNIEKNSADSRDNITLLALIQAWPIDTWNSLTARAIHQAQKMKALAKDDPNTFQSILSIKDLKSFLIKRNNGEKIIGGMLGTEGSHALDGKLENIDILFNEGYRMMGLQHFFDNELGGSLHGEGQQGLSEFGKLAVDRMTQKFIMIDVAHSSEKVVEDVLSRVQRPLIVSHTGFHGNCPNSRNISDALMKKIADAGGLIGVGYWDKAACDISPKGIVKSIIYGIELVGIDHIALGSDYDGSTSVAFDISELAVLTEEMLKANFSEFEIRKVMGENMVDFLLKNLPKN